MTEIVKKTLAEHKGYVEKMSRLSFFFARKLKDRTPDKTVGNILRDCTPLFFHALDYLDYETKWNNPDCLRIAAKADELQELQVSEFEERMYAEIKDLAMTRAEQFYPVSVGILMPEDWNVRSLKYDTPRPNLPPNYCNFHIANALAPRSIYDEPRHLPECFMELMDRSEKEHGYDTLTTGTWLNDTPRWLALFPEEWTANLTPRGDGSTWHFGYWGQMVTARGTFNEKAGLYSREYGKLRYESRGSHCSFAAMREHLKNITNGGV